MPDSGSTVGNILRFNLGLRLLVLPLFVAASGIAWPEQLNVVHYDTRDGLPQVQVLAVNQCSKGYIWLGTFSGLSRFNGQRFRHFYARDGLRSNHITDLETDADGRLWVATNAGLCRLIGSEKFSCPDYPGLVDVHINALHAGDDAMWVASEAGLFRIVDDSSERIELGEQDGASVVYGVVSDGQGRLWAGSAAGLHYLARDNPDAVTTVASDLELQITALAVWQGSLWVGADRGLFEWTDGELQVIDGLEWLHALDVAHLLVENPDRLWIATANGLVQYQQEQFERFTTANRLASDIFHQTFLDREGILWLAHDNGLSKLLPSQFYGYTTDSGLLSSFVRTIAEDEQGRLWLGSRNGVQIVPWKAGQWRIDESKTITAADGLYDERIYSIEFPAPGEALLATSHGVVHWREGDGVLNRFEEDDGLPSNRTRALLTDSGGRTWISTHLGTAVLVGGKIEASPIPELSAAYAMRIREDSMGGIWFATLRHGLVAVDSDGLVRQWRGADGLTDEMLWDVAPSASGSVWVGSNGDGLFQIDKDGLISHYTTGNGLADNFVWQVLVDDEGRVWAYTNRGLSRIDEDGIVNFGESDGLLHLEGAATAALQTQGGDIWFGSADGLMRYGPDDRRRTEVPPLVAIEEVRLGSRMIESGDRLPYRPGSLQFLFSGLSFFDEDAVTYRYRLTDIEQDWSDGGYSDSVTYAGLTGGDYVFEVQARSAHGTWSNTVASFSFSVESPFWATWWFWAGVVFMTAVLARVGLYLREQSVRARQLELEQMVSHRTAELSEANRRLEHASRTDPLTGLHNRRYLLDRIDQDIAETRRHHADSGRRSNRDMIFMMVDMDHFKSVNDRHGHDAGDQVLCELTRLFGHELRASDDLIRWGGEEFLVVARNAEAGLAREIADRIVCAARNHSVYLNGSDAVVVPTCSVGIATYPFVAEFPELLDWEQTIQLADLAVYMAKNKGRDGWVWLRAGDLRDVSDGDAILEQIRDRRDQLLAEGQLLIESSFE